MGRSRKAPSEARDQGTKYGHGASCEAQLFYGAFRSPGVTGMRVAIIVKRSERPVARSPIEVSTGKRGDRGSRRVKRETRAEDIAIKLAMRTVLRYNFTAPQFESITKS